MDATHKHTRVKGQSRTISWSHCVAMGAPCNGMGHGNIVVVDRCNCGAEQEYEVNGIHSRSSGWFSPPKEG